MSLVMLPKLSVMQPYSMSFRIESRHEIINLICIAMPSVPIGE